MTDWIEETFHPHWRVRLEATPRAARGEDRAPAPGDLREPDLGHRADAGRRVPAHHLGRVRLPRDDGARAPDGAGQAQARAGDRRRRRRRAARGAEAPLGREGDPVRDRPHRDRHGAAALSGHPGQGVRGQARRHRHRRRPEVRRRDRRAVRCHHRRQLRADRAERRAAHARVLHRLQARPEGRWRPGHAERAAVPVSRAPAGHHGRVRLAVQAGGALHVHAALLFRRTVRAQSGDRRQAPPQARRRRPRQAAEEARHRRPALLDPGGATSASFALPAYAQQVVDRAIEEAQ